MRWVRYDARPYEGGGGPVGFHTTPPFKACIMEDNRVATNSPVSILLRDTIHISLFGLLQMMQNTKQIL